MTSELVVKDRGQPTRHLGTEKTHQNMLELGVMSLIKNQVTAYRRNLRYRKPQSMTNLGNSSNSSQEVGVDGQCCWSGGGRVVVGDGESPSRGEGDQYEGSANSLN